MTSFTNFNKVESFESRRLQNKYKKQNYNKIHQYLEPLIKYIESNDMIGIVEYLIYFLAAKYTPLEI